MAYTAITVEGGLFPAELLEAIATAQAKGQQPADFGLDGARLSDEVQGAFSDARAFWDAFQRRRAHSRESPTTLTREYWVKPLLERLGYELVYQPGSAQAGGESFPISHRAGAAPDAPPVHIVALDQPLDRRADGARRSPHALVQEYLNRSDALWGLVTNGERLRLLRDSARVARPTYVEFDLRALVESNLYSEFVLLYRLLHRSRLPRGVADAPHCWLERYYQQGLDLGGRVRERLRDGVVAALETLGNAFLRHPQSAALRAALAAGRLDAAGYYRQLLRLIYRLLFLLVVEERRLVFPPGDRDPQGRPLAIERQALYTAHYSVSRLRARCEDPRAVASSQPANYHDLWVGLGQTFRLFRDADAARLLGLTPLDGELFGADACPDLEAAACDNASLLCALHHLVTFEDGGVRRRVNYAALDTEELGSVYESLLDYRPLLDPAAPQPFALAAGSERKQTGSYYTPPALVRVLVERALEPVLAERLRGAPTPQEREAALLALRVCDPAAGSGHFLLAAARRLGRELARVRSGEAEPAPEAYRAAVRDVVRQCLYGVDRNPLAVDLCKVALWLEGHSAGLPLSFLDHHVKCGDSLVGVWDLAVLAEGVPDGAYEPVAGDDRRRAAAFKRRNQQERQGQLPLEAAPPADAATGLAAAFGTLAALDERTAADVQAKEALYAELRARGTRWYDLHTACDLWTAAFFVPLAAGDGADLVPTTATVRGMLTHPAAAHGELVGRAVALARERRAFHWPLEFPEVWAAGGFDVVLGNPPWEKVEMDEPEWFASHDPTIAKLPGIKRKQAIAALEKTQSPLWLEFQQASRDVAGFAKFIRQSGRFCLTGQGRINLYALFAELSWRLLNARGRAGILVPTGIATDDTTKRFFQTVVERGALAALFDFENRGVFFPHVDSRYKFCVLVLAAARQARGELAFFLTHPDQLRDARRVFALDAADFALLNPNTRTCSVFRTRVDADLTRAIYRRVPVLVDERANANPWGVEFKQGLFNMTSDSGLFATAPAPDRVPLYEAKLFHQFDHRFATFVGGERTREATAAEHADPRWQPTPRYWVARAEVERRLAGKWDRPWLIAFRDITNSTNERTAIFCVLPRVAVGHKAPLVLAQDASPAQLAAFVGCCNSLVLDYVARQKVGGVSMAYFIVKQFPVLPPAAYTAADLAFIVPRVLELVYTAWDLQPFARDLGYDGPPLRWDEDRRAVLRAELDAYYAALYGLTYDELRYILDPADVYGPDFPGETFRVLKQNELTRYGEYRTRRLVLEAWERLGLAPRHRDGRYPAARAAGPPAPSRGARSGG